MKSLHPILLLSIASFYASATEIIRPEHTDSARLGEWHLGIAIGYGMKTNPLKNYRDIPLYLTADISYYGKQWFFDNGALGHTLVDQRDFALNLVGDLSSDSAYLHRWDPSNVLVQRPLKIRSPAEPASLDRLPEVGELESRRFTYLGGLEAFIYRPYGTWRVALLHDLLTVHQGMEGQILWNHQWQKDKLTIELDASLDWKSHETIEYYYGVRSTESPYWHQAYKPGSGWHSGLGLSARYHLTPKWELLVRAHYTRFAATLADSPLMEDAQSYAYLFAAGYRF